MLEVILFISLFVFITGACIGSFLNVVALRALTNESIVFPSSKCPVCGESIKWYDNIPIFSYLFTFRGKCRNCGCHVSRQYPIVETITALLFVAVYLFFGISIQSILLLILLCTSIVITITDLKENVIYDRHSWTLIITAIVYSLYIKGLENYSFTVIGLISGVIAMELIARLSYYLVKKKTENVQEDNEETAVQTEAVTEAEAVEETSNEDKEQEEEQAEDDEDINTYIEKNKRAFGEGDTYIAAAAGAVLGWKYLLLTLFCSIVLQALCILPQFIKNLYEDKQYRLLSSLTGFFILAIAYFTVSNIITMNVITAAIFVILLVFFAFDSITRLKKTTNQKGFIAIPFGPALLITTFIILFFGKDIASFLNKYIFMMIG